MTGRAVAPGAVPTGSTAPSFDTVLSIDIGGTKTQVGIVSRSGEVLLEATRPTRERGDSAGDRDAAETDEIERALRFGCAFAKSSAFPAPRAVVAGVPEYVSVDGSVDSCEVLRWNRQPSEVLAELVSGLRPPAVASESRGTGAASGIESDVRLGALGEAAYGAARALDSFLYVSLGTGLSSTFVLGGTPWAGARGQAIALGEFAVSAGRNLEQTASGTALAERYAEAAGERVPGPEIVSRAARGDALAADVLRTAGEALGDALADTAELLDPHGIVVGGGLGAANTPVMVAARQRYRSRTDRRPGAAVLLTASCGARSALLGGAAAAWRLSEG